MNLLVILLAHEVLEILAPEEYNDVIYVIPRVAISILIMLLFNLFANIEYYFKQTKMPTMTSVFSAVTNLILIYVFIKRFGFIVAGYTAVNCYVLFSFFLYSFMRRFEKKFLDVHRVYNERFLAVITSWYIVAGLVIVFLYGEDLIAIRYAIFALLLYSLFTWITLKQRLAL